MSVETANLSRKGKTRRAIRQIRLAPDGSCQMTKRSKSDRHPRRLLMPLFGQTGTHLVSLSALLTAMLLTGHHQPFIYEMVAVLVLARVFYCMTRGPRPVLPGRFVRRKQGQVVADEIKIGIALAAASFLLQWPVALHAVVIFAAFNLAGQCTFAVLSHRFMLRPASRRTAGEAQQ